MTYMDINLEVLNLETDFFGDLHCSSRFTDMLCDAQAQYGDYSELEKCPMWGKEGEDEIKALRKTVGNGGKGRENVATYKNEKKPLPRTARNVDEEIL